ncbi:N-acetylneuraminate lyase [Flavobacteriaceae bacterium MAR_2010_188]|nr:N-acetylneuraminate lyase [Flavobacteriaceae bacterium MAR_2010_188]
MKLNINGIIAATFSPFDENENLNLEIIPILVDELIKQGIGGFYINGSTGEGMSMPLNKRIRVAEAYLKAVDKRVPCIISVSHTSYEVSRDLTKHAIEVGADAVSATPPSYYGINSIEQLALAVEKIANCQEKIPFIYYHIPDRTGLRFRMYSFLEIIGNRVPTLSGVKFTSSDLDDFLRCDTEFGDRFKMYFGRDELFLPALAIGADSFIGSTYNFLLPKYLEIIKCHNKGNSDEAISIFDDTVQIIHEFLKYDGLASQKAIMKMMGFNFGPPKSPVLDLTTNDYNSLKNYLKTEKIFENHIS